MYLTIYTSMCLYAIMVHKDGVTIDMCPCVLLDASTMVYAEPVLPLGQLGSHLGCRPQRGALLTFEGQSFIQISCFKKKN